MGIADPGEGGSELLNPLDSLYPRELDVLALVAVGATNKRIALELGIAPSTTKAYVESILAKLSVPNRAAAAAMWQRYRTAPGGGGRTAG